MNLYYLHFHMVFHSLSRTSVLLWDHFCLHLFFSFPSLPTSSFFQLSLSLPLFLSLNQTECEVQVSSEDDDLTLYPVLTLKYILSMREVGIPLYVSSPEKKYQNYEGFYFDEMK